MPIRVQRKRTKGWKMPENTVSVTRPGKWGNPYKVGGSLLDVPFLVLKKAELTDDEAEAGIITAEISVTLYRTWLHKHYEGMQILAKAIAWLPNKNLACFCPLDKPCHADVLLQIANTPTL